MNRERSSWMPDPAALEAIGSKIRRRVGTRVSDLSIEISNGRLVLSGSARSYYTKQLATHAAAEAVSEGVMAEEIQNDIVVAAGGAARRGEARD